MKREEVELLVSRLKQVIRTWDQPIDQAKGKQYPCERVQNVVTEFLNEQSLGVFPL